MMYKWQWILMYAPPLIFKTVKETNLIEIKVRMFIDTRKPGKLSFRYNLIVSSHMQGSGWLGQWSKFEGLEVMISFDLIISL